MNNLQLNAQRISVLFVALVMAAVLSPFTQAALAGPASTNDPQNLVSDTINQLIDRLRENIERIKSDERLAYQISDDLVAPHIDFPRVTRLVIGKYWHDASTAQRRQLNEEIRTLLIRSYVTAMTSYADQIVAHKNRISYLPSRYQPGDTKASVRANITLESGQVVEVQYQLYYTDNEWKIYDIRIEGISLAITYRTTFGEKIKREGLDSLIAQLSEKNLNGEVELPTSLNNSNKK